MTYQPDLVQQADGSPLQWQNCTCASGAIGLDRDTKGASKTTGARVRQLTGVGAGGTNLAQIDVALYLGWPPDDHLDVRYMMAFEDACHEVASGHGAVIQGSYSVFAGTMYDGSPGFRGNHAEWLNDVRLLYDLHGRIDYQASEAQIYDPLWDGRSKGIPSKQMRWVPLWLVRDFCAKLSFGGGQQVGQGYCYVGFTRDTEPAAPKPVQTIVYGSNPMIVSGGIKKLLSHRAFMAQGTRLRISPSLTSKVVTRMSANGAAKGVGYEGNAGPGWKAVYVSTGNFPDRVVRPVTVYVQAKDIISIKGGYL